MSKARKSIRMVEAFALNSDLPENLRLVRDFGNHAIAMRPTWSRITELQHKCDVGTITATEALELLALERSQA